MIKNDNRPQKTYCLDLTKSDTEMFLSRWGRKTFGVYSIPWILADFKSIGFGTTKSSYDSQFVVIGAAEFLSSRHKPDDYSVVTMGVSLFHEFRHCEQNLGKDSKGIIDKYMITNLLSTFGNECYYYGNWTQMPYEIDAEYSGVSNMRIALLDLCDEETVDKCMLDYVNFRSKHTAYFIPYLDEGYKNMDEVNKAFEKTYDDSILCKREAQPRLSKYLDEFPRLMRLMKALDHRITNILINLLRICPAERKTECSPPQFFICILICVISIPN